MYHRISEEGTLLVSQKIGASFITDSHLFTLVFLEFTAPPGCAAPTKGRRGLEETIEGLHWPATWKLDIQVVQHRVAAGENLIIAGRPFES